MSRDQSFRFKLYNARQPHRTAGVPDEEWEKYENTITKMHNDKVTVASMLRYLKREYAFEPSFGQLAKKLKDWGLRRYRRRSSTCGDNFVIESPSEGFAQPAQAKLDAYCVSEGQPDSKYDMKIDTRFSCIARCTERDAPGDDHVDIMITSLSMSPASYSSFRDYAQTLSLDLETAKQFNLDIDIDMHVRSTPSSWNFERATGLHSSYSPSRVRAL